MRKENNMTQININFDKTIGKIKPMHAVGQPPFIGGSLSFDFSNINYLKNANIPYSRLHDVGGAFGGNRFVDIPNIFRDFDADVDNPLSYDFSFTDVLIEAMYEYGIKPIFRLGVTIENQAHIKAYRIHPPKDMKKWAKICEHIIRHYNEGWADGFQYGIEYWEIWNEPENHVQGLNQMWTGTAEQYYELYDITAKHLKNCFGKSIKVGGYSASGFYGTYYDPQKYNIDVPKREPDERYEKDTYRVEFLYGFLNYIKANNTPIDFFSWHSYAGVEKTVILSKYLNRVLCEYGYEGLETHMNEWNNAHDLQQFGTSYASAAVAAMMCAMQNTTTDMMCYYDAAIGVSGYRGLFDAYTRKPVCTYYSFVAFGELYALGNQVDCAWVEPNVYCVAAMDDEKKAIMLVNHSEEAKDIQMNIEEGFETYLIDENHFYDKVDITPNHFTLEANQVVLIKNFHYTIRS